MRGLRIFICVFYGALLSFFVANAYAQVPLRSYAAQYPTPLLIENNAEALKLRLALLAHAGPGSHVRVATFVFDFGDAVKALSSEMCAAAQRGAKVELLVDAKSGDLPGVETVNNGSIDAKSSEELYQYMANCGVHVSIHNSTRDYVSIAGHRLPNFFGPEYKPGASVLFDAKSRITELREVLLEQLQSVRSQLHLQNDFDHVLENMQGLGMEYSVAFTPTSDNTVMGRDLRALIADPIWSELSVDQMRNVTKAIQHAITTNNVLKYVRAQIREFNRLNHRKIFLVENPDGTSCGIIGGRNLGDHYLTNKPDSYFDGDVLTCSRQSSEIPAYHAAIAASFQDLLADRTDPAIGATNVVVESVPANGAFQYKRINISEISHLRSFDDSTVRGFPLKKFREPELLLAGWDKYKDRVNRHLLEAILREQKEIYIESAYAEFDQALRRALDQAMDRGVKVLIVTNSMFISDGASKFVRVLMSHWNEEMKRKHGSLFQMGFADSVDGHMIHFKGAGFRCQIDGQRRYRTYFIGSHNFHPRSGYSDKENTVQWKEGTDCSTPSEDLITSRIRFYQQHPVLVDYPSLSSEIEEVSLREGSDAALARVLNQTLYTYNPQTRKMEPTRQFVHMIDLWEKGGLLDLFGLLF